MFYSFIFQILSGIYAIHKLCSICHFDLHGGNILISKIESMDIGYIMLKIQIIIFLILDIFLKIWDFGRSMIINKDNFKDIKLQIIHQCKRFYKEPFKKNPKLEKKIYKKLNMDNIKIILFAFDIWRIKSYLYSKIKKESYLEIKFKKTLELLVNIKKDCENNWVILILIILKYLIHLKFLLNIFLKNILVCIKKKQTELINKNKYFI